jgi:hypothetical protein
MGYIPDGARTLTAYHTQKGREYIVSGDKDGFSIKYFGLSDSDVNYLVASQPGPSSDFNMLDAGEIPDLSGDQTGAIHSLAGGVKQRYFLFGGNAISYLGTNKTLGTTRLGVRFASTNINVTLAKNTAGYQNVYFNLPVELFGGSATGLEAIKLYPLPPSQGTSAEIYAALTADPGNNGGITTWAQGEALAKNVTVGLFSSLAVGQYTLTARFKMVPYKSALSLDPRLSVIKVNITLNVTAFSGNGSSSTGGVGFNYQVRSDVGLTF